MPSDIIGSYRISKALATGQYSQILEVVEMSSSRHFAMKLLLPEHVHNAVLREELLHEAGVGLKLAHVNVIKIHKVEKSPKQPYFVMDFFPAGSMKTRIQHWQEEKDFIKAQAQFIFRQGATALAYMNAHGFVHRDVKPENFLVNSAGELRLIDFALAQKIPKGLSKLFYRQKDRQGTRSYMSPEQIECKPLDGRADLYSFGATCYEIVTGRPPFRAATSEDLLNKHLYEKPVAPQTINREVTDDFGDLVMKMLAKKREERQRNFHEVLINMRKMKIFKDQRIQKGRDV